MWPSTSTEKLPEYVVVTYPGVVRNAEKAIETLGGAQTLSTVSEKNQLKLFLYCDYVILHSNLRM